MARKLSLIILIITVLCLAFSLTSCDATSEDFADSLHGFLPDRDSSVIAEYAHRFVDWAAEEMSSLFSFDWAKSIWEWLDNTFGITDKIEQSRIAFELIKTGDFKNILEGLEILFGCGILLLLLGLLVIVTVAIAVVIEVLGNILTFVLVAIVIPVILIVAVVAIALFVMSALAASSN